MKRIITVLICLSMIMSLFTFFPVMSADLVVFSESFENGYSEWTLKTESYRDKISIVEDKSTDGKKSIKFTDDVEDVTFSITSKKIPVKAGMDYLLNVDCYSPEGSAAKIYLQFLNFMKK